MYSGYTLHFLNVDMLMDVQRLLINQMEIENNV